MHTRQRNHDDPQPAQATLGGPGELDQLRAGAERLLAVGADAIDRALSGDSPAYLEANRQEGGQ